MYLLGSHVGMSGKDMMLGSVKTALSYGANTFMLYTGAPQNTRRKKIEELNIPAARELMKENEKIFVVKIGNRNYAHKILLDKWLLAQVRK